MKCKKKNLIREGPFRAIRQLIKKIRLICCYIVFYQNPKFEVFRFENGENARLRRTNGKTNSLEY
jgi:hypothetical protein